MKTKPESQHFGVSAKWTQNDDESLTPWVVIFEGMSGEKRTEIPAAICLAAPAMRTALKAILTITARHGGTENDAEAITAIEQLAAVAVRDAEGK